MKSTTNLPALWPMQKMDMNTYLHLVKKEPEALKQDLHNRARDVIKGRLVFSAIAKAEGMQVTPEDLEQEVKDPAAQYGMDDAKLRKALEEKGQLGAFEQSLLMDKVQKFLSDNAKPMLPQPAEEEGAAPEPEAPAVAGGSCRSCGTGRGREFISCLIEVASRAARLFPRGPFYLK